MFSIKVNFMLLGIVASACGSERSEREADKSQTQYAQNAELRFECEAVFKDRFLSRQGGNRKTGCRLSRSSDAVSAKICLENRVGFGFRRLLGGRACTPQRSPQARCEGVPYERPADSAWIFRETP